MRSREAYVWAWIVVVATGLAVVPFQRSFAREPQPIPSPSTVGPEPATEPPATSASAGRLSPGSQATEGSDLDTFKLPRYDEDYSYFRDPSLRTSYLDVLKYILLGGWDGYYLSLGDTARPRIDYTF